MLNKGTAQRAMMGSIVVIALMLAGCQSAQSIGAEAAQDSAGQVSPNLRSIDPADRKFYTDSLDLLGGASSPSAAVDPADRKFFTDSLTVVIPPTTNLESVDPADRKFFTDSLEIQAGMDQGCRPMAPEDLLKVHPADRKFYLWSSSC